MNWLKKVFSGEKKEEGDAEHFFFICSGNASLINAYDNMFKQAAAADTKKTMILESPAHYSAKNDTLARRAEEAGKASLKFDGQSYMGSKATPMLNMDDVLQKLRVESLGELHIAYISVSQAGLSWVEKVYTELLRQAASQGILPYNMYVTKDKSAAQFLLGSFERKL